MIVKDELILLKKIMVDRQRSVNPSKFKDEVFELYSIPAYDKGIPEITKGCNIGSSKKIVKEGDVLLSRIVPHIRRAWVVPKSNGKRQIASGEWIVFRGNDFVPNFLRHLLMSDVFHVQFMNTVAGVGGSLLRARPEYVSEIKIPLPPLSEQKRIADILDKADAIRHKRQEACRVSTGLFKAVFYHTFGRDFLDHGDNVPLESLVDQERGISYGVVQRGSHDPTGIPVARISNIVANVFDDSDFVRVSPEISGKYKRTVLNGGELLISIRGTVGRTAIAPERAAGWNVTREVAVIPLQPHVSRRFIHQLILTDEAQRFITGNVKGVAQRGINLKDLRLLPVPSLDSDLVELFRNRIRRLESFDHNVANAESEADDLFNSLLQRAFQGEL